MNILQIRGEFSDNGPGMQALSISLELRRQGHYVIMCSSGGHLNQKIEKYGVKHYIIPEIAFEKRTPFNVIKSILSVRRIIREHNIEIFHAHNAASLVICHIASILSFRFGLKYFQSVRGLEMRESFQWRNLIYRFYKFNALFAVSEYTKKKLVGIGVDESRIVVTYNGPDLSIYNLKKKDVYRKDILNEFSIPQDAVVVGIIGGQDGNKGHRHLINAFKKIEHKNKNVHILLVGVGDQLDSNKNLASKMNARNRIHFAGLRMDSERFHAAFDIFVLFSDFGYEMFPNVIVEAMSYAVPFISTNTTGVPEAAKYGGGIICECEDLACLSKNLDKLINNPAIRNSMGKKGYNAVLNIFNISNVVATIESSYKNY